MEDTTFSKPMNALRFLQEEPNAEPYLRPFVGSREFLQGKERWILRLADVEPQVLRTLPKVRERIICCPRLSVGEQKQAHPDTCRDTDALPCERRARRAVSSYTRSEF